MKKQTLFKIKLLKKYILRFLYFIVQNCHKNKIDKNKIKHITIVRLKHLGDFLLAMPVVYAIKQAYPGAKITIITGIWNKGLVNFFNLYFNKTLFYNLDENCRATNQIMTISQKIRALKNIFKIKQDICFDFDGSFAFLLMYLLRRTKCLSTIEALRMWQNLEQLKIIKSKYKYNIHEQYEKNNLSEILKILNRNEKQNGYKYNSKNL